MPENAEWKALEAVLIDCGYDGTNTAVSQLSDYQNEYRKTLSEQVKAVFGVNAAVESKCLDELLENLSIIQTDEAMGLLLGRHNRHPLRVITINALAIGLEAGKRVRDAQRLESIVLAEGDEDGRTRT